VPEKKIRSHFSPNISQCKGLLRNCG
jgi:hypothetical protein